MLSDEICFHLLDLAHRRGSIHQDSITAFCPCSLSVDRALVARAPGRAVCTAAPTPRADAATILATVTDHLDPASV